MVQLVNVLHPAHLTFINEKIYFLGLGVVFFPSQKSIILHLKIPACPFTYCLCVPLSYPNTGTLPQVHAMCTDLFTTLKNVICKNKLPGFSDKICAYFPHSIIYAFKHAVDTKLGVTNQFAVRKDFHPNGKCS